MVRSLLVLFVAAGGLAAADPKLAAKLRQALDATGDVVFEEKSLIEVRDLLKAKLKADVIFDTAAIAATGLDPNLPTFTVKSRGAKVRDGIRAALAPQNLFFGIVAGNLFIGSEADVTTRQMRQRVSLDGEATTLGAVLKSLADETGVNLTLDPRVLAQQADPAVKLKLDDVPLETAVRLAAEVGGLAAVRMNNVLFVTTEERAAKLAPAVDPPTPIPVPAAPNPFAPVVPFGGLGGLLKPLPSK
jgi:hypothetical protein